MGQGLSRRAILAGGGGALAAGAVVGGGVTMHLGAPAPGALTLTAREMVVIDAVAEILFPGDPFPLNGIEAEVARDVDRIVGEVLEPLHATAFRYVLRALEWGTLAGRGRRFSRLPESVRADVLATWKEPETVARRVAGDSLRVVLGMAYFSHPEILASMGWRATCGGDSV